MAGTCHRGTVPDMDALLGLVNRTELTRALNKRNVEVKERTVQRWGPDLPAHYRQAVVDLLYDLLEAPAQTREEAASPIYWARRLMADARSLSAALGAEEATEVEAAVAAGEAEARAQLTDAAGRVDPGANGPTRAGPRHTRGR